MKKALNILIIFFALFIFASCSSNENNNDYSNNSIEFHKTKLEYYVGDSIELNNQLLKANLSQVSIQNVVFSNALVAYYDSNLNTIICTEEGTTEIYITAICPEGTNLKTQTANLKVSYKPVFATDIIFEQENIVLNYNEINKVYNSATVLLDNNTSVLFSENYNEEVNPHYSFLSSKTIEYSKSGYIEYDPETGLINPIIDRSKLTDVVEIEVKLFARNSKLTRIFRSFKVTLTNFDYATDFMIDNVNFNALNEEFISYNTQHIELFTNSNYNLFEIKMTPYSNIAPKIEVLTNGIQIIDNKIVTLSNESNNEQIKITIATGKNEFLSKIVNIKLINKIDNLNFVLTNSTNENISEIFKNENDSYFIKFNTNINLDINNFIYNSEYSLISTTETNKFKINFNNIEEIYSINLVFSYQQNTYFESIKISSNNEVILFYNISNNFYLTFNNSLIENYNANNPILNHYNMLAINYEFEGNALEDGVAYFADFNINAEGLNVKENNFSLFVNYNNNIIPLSTGENIFTYAHITINENNVKIYSKLEGVFSLIVKSNDYNAFEKSFTFNITNSEIENVNNDNVLDSIKLYLNSENILNYPTSFNLNNFYSTPFYAIDNNFTLKIENTNICEINNNVLTAISLGEANLLAINENNKVISVFKIIIDAYSTDISILFENQETILTNVSYEFVEEKLYLDSHFQFKIYSNNISINTKNIFTLNFIDEQGNVIESSDVLNLTWQQNHTYKFSFKKYGMQKISYEFTHNEKTFTGVISFLCKQPFAEIESIEFESYENKLVNLYYTNVVENPLTITSSNSELEMVSDNLTVESNNNNVIVDSLGNITLLYNVGEILPEPLIVIITATLVKESETIVKSYNIEIYYLAPTAEIINIEFDSYENKLVNLYYTNIVENPLTITSSNSELELVSDNLTVESNNSNVIVDSLGNVTLLYNAGEVLPDPVVITITATLVKESEIIVKSYNIEIYYLAPTAEIDSIEFESYENKLVNLYYTNIVENPLTITSSNSELELVSDNLTVESNNNNVVVDSLGNITLLYNVGEVLTEPIIVTITATLVKESEIIVKSYNIEIYYLAPIAEIDSIEFESYENKLVNLYYTNIVENPLIITSSNTELELVSDNLTVESNNNNVIVDSLGNVKLLYNIGEVLTEPVVVTITATLVKEYETIVRSYDIEIYYLAPTAEIDSIEFDSYENKLVNLYYTNIVENPLIITSSNSELELVSDNLTIESNNNNVVVDSLGNITLLYNVGEVLIEPIIVTITATLVKESETIVKSYNIEIYYLAPKPEVFSLKFENNEINEYFSDEDSFVILSMKIILNNDESVNFDNSDIVIIENNNNLKVNVNNKVLFIEFISSVTGEIKIAHKDNNNISDTLVFNVSKLALISKSTDLIKLNNSTKDFILSADIELSSDFESIVNFNGALKSLNKKFEISNINAPVFENLLENAKIENIKFTSSLLNFQNTGNEFGLIALVNYGEINEVEVSLKVNSNKEMFLGGAVYENYGTIKNSFIEIDEFELTQNTSRAGLLVYKNYGSIDFVNIKANSISAVPFLSGVVYDNHGNKISNCVVNLVLNIENKSITNFFGFIYTNSNEYFSEIVNCKLYLTINSLSLDGVRLYGVGNDITNIKVENISIFLNYNNYTSLNIAFYRNLNSPNYFNENTCLFTNNTSFDANDNDLYVF